MRLGDHETSVVARAGTRLTADDAREIAIDSVLRTTSDRPLRVRYQAAAQPGRSRVTDELVLNHLPGRRSWRAGETISEFEVTVSSHENP